MSNDDIVFLDEDAVTGDEDEILGQWNVLIVDDEPEVHRVTKLALDGFVFASKSINFISTYTGEEARKLLSETDLDIGVILLDVVMETDHAGLETAQWIREELKNTYVRIVLRTGQPGQAPEREVISSYDINDYKEKTELTARKLYTLMIATLRSYRDIKAIANNKRGLKKIIDASANIFEYQSLEKFTSGALMQLSALFHLNQGAVYGRSKDGLAAVSLADGDIKVLAGTGKFCGLEGSNLEQVLPDDYSISEIQTYLEEGKSGFVKNTYVGVFKTKTGIVNLLFLLGADHPDVDIALIDIFARNIGIAFENLQLLDTLDHTQRGIVYRLGEAVEGRSEETGYHVKRVGKICKLLAKAYGLDTRDCEIIEYASPLHDVGKIVIPDAILEKPGPLDADEWEIMKSHAQKGTDMLSGSDQPVIRAASLIAGEHHEKWDGTGYPNGKSGEDIDIMARITGIADVFDAVSNPRCYKEAWGDAEVLQLLKDESGKHFDPKLVEILLENMDEIMEIKHQYAD